MDTKPLISVIITTFNRCGIIGRAIDAVLCQDYPNFEIIVVDDHSSDNTQAFLCEHYSDKITYIKHEKNMGVQFASNTGYAQAKGEYLAFIGDDDEWNDPSKLSKQAQVFIDDTEKKYGIVTCSVKIIRPNETFVKTITRPKNLSKHLLASNGIIYGSAALIRRDAFELAGRFKPDQVKGTDSDVFRRISLLGYDAYFSEEPMIDYHEDNNDRMTGSDLRALRKSILSQTYKLRYYKKYYDLFPAQERAVCRNVGDMYYQIFLITMNKDCLLLASKFYFASTFLYVWPIKPFLKAVFTRLKYVF